VTISVSISDGKLLVICSMPIVSRDSDFSYHLQMRHNSK
jgi:hypothetical protein